jgi:hypothetical protein
LVLLLRNLPNACRTTAGEEAGYGVIVVIFEARSAQVFVEKGVKGVAAVGR